MRGTTKAAIAGVASAASFAFFAWEAYKVNRDCVPEPVEGKKLVCAIKQPLQRGIAAPAMALNLLVLLSLADGWRRQ